MSNFTSSVIVRVKNEASNMRKLCALLQSQTTQDFEVVVVNDHSSDGSERVADEYFSAGRAHVVNLQRPFNYAYASNLGAEIAKGKFLVYLSAHSFPVSDVWLERGLRHFVNTKVAGVFALPLAHKNTNWVEKALINIPTYLFHSRLKHYKKASMGVMGATNAIYRKDLWLQHAFSEKYIIGGEDAEWARHFSKLGFEFVQDPEFRVYHSHHLGSLGLIRQSFKYQKMMQVQD